MKGHTWKKYIRKFLQTISDSAHKLHIFHLLTVSFFSLKKPEKIGPLIFFASLISVHFQGKPFNNTVIQVYAPTTNAEDLQDLLVCSVSSVAQSCPTLCHPMNCSTPGSPVHHQLLELAQAHVHRVSDAIQLSHPLSPSPPAFNLSQHQGPFQWVSSLHQVAKVLEFQLQHQSFQWIFRTHFI